MDAVQEIRDFNAGRDPERLAMKYSAMRSSAFAFLRGSCHLFYARLPRGGVLKSAPLAWVCGDLHLENFGSYKGDNQLVYFDVNDFDESALAPASWDLVRFLTSQRVWAADGQRGESSAEALCTAFLDAYSSALSSGKAYSVERETAQGLVHELLDALRDRTRLGFLEARTTLKKGRRQLNVDGRKALAATEAQRASVTDLVSAFAKRQADPGFFEVLDVVRRVAGTGSLGLDRFAILVRGKGSPDGNHILDLKQTRPSSLLPKLPVAQPKWATEAHRVVAVQRRMQAVPMALLQPVVYAGAPGVMRALQPAEDRVNLGKSERTERELAQLMDTMGRLLAWAQLRSAGRDGSADADELIEFGARPEWTAQLLEISRGCARQLTADAALYNQAWDEGSLRV